MHVHANIIRSHRALLWLLLEVVEQLQSYYHWGALSYIE